MTKLYLAAPLFTKEERSLNLEITDILSQKFSVYLPQRDGILLDTEVKQGKPAIDAKREIFSLDCKAIKESDILFAVLNGRSIDEGVAFELGFAYALRKSCWSYKQDWRSLLKYGDNPMIECAISNHFNSIEELQLFVSEM